MSARRTGLEVLFDSRHFVGNFVESPSEFDDLFSNINCVDKVLRQAQDQFPTKFATKERKVNSTLNTYLRARALPNYRTLVIRNS